MTLRRTIVVPVPPSAPRSSARDRASALPAAAKWTGSAPGPGPAPARNVRFPRSSRCSLGARGFCLVIRLVAVIVFPVPLLLQRVGHFSRHIVLVVLGEHRIGLEYAGGIERALGDN